MNPQATSWSLAVLLAFLPAVVHSAEVPPASPSEALTEYVTTDLQSALEKARQTKKRVMLYTGAPNLLRGQNPRALFFSSYPDTSETIRKALPHWIVCERFLPQQAFIASLDGYGIHSFHPCVTLLDSDGKKIAGAFGPGEAANMARHLDPPETTNPADVAKGRDFVVFTAEYMDSPTKPGGLLVATTPFLTKKQYAFIHSDHQFSVKKMAEPFPDADEPFHTAFIFVSGRFTPPLAANNIGQEHAVFLFQGNFFTAQVGTFRSRDPLLRGMNGLEMDNGDDWLGFMVDKKEHLDALLKHLESLKAPPPK